MSKEDLEIDDDFIAEDAEEIEDESPAQAAKTNLTKRRTIDNLLEERRLQKLLAEYDYDIDWYLIVDRPLGQQRRQTATNMSICNTARALATPLSA